MSITTARLVVVVLFGVEGNRVRARHVLSAGDECYCALSWAEDLAAPADVAEASRRLDATTRFWRNWLGRARMPDHRPDVICGDHRAATAQWELGRANRLRTEATE